MLTNNELIEAVLNRVPGADPFTVIDLIASCDGDVNRVLALLGVQPASRKRQATFDDFTTTKPSNVKKTSAESVNLYTPAQVENANIWCILIHDVLDASVANRLAADLNDQSVRWERNSFYLFNRKVTSGHATAMYTDREAILSGKEPSSYQGVTLSPDKIFPFTTELKLARDEIVSIVRNKTNNPDWESSVAVINRYGSRSEKLDYHSDQLTHLGTRPTIAALSLGCTREFKLKDRAVPPQRPTYSIRVPHNSLIIMYGECQERFKHCVPVAKSLDPDALLGTVRFSLTFRMYRPEFNQNTIPRCSCNSSMVLRSTLPDKHGNYKYIWQCSQHYQDGQGCNETRLYTKFS